MSEGKSDCRILRGKLTGQDKFALGNRNDDAAAQHLGSLGISTGWPPSGREFCQAHVSFFDPAANLYVIGSDHDVNAALAAGRSSSLQIFINQEADERPQG